MDSFTPQLGTVVALLGLVPVVAYVVGRPGELFAVAAALNVVLIFAVLWTVFGDHEDQPATA
jgi:Na+/melibiose symporter-like transporter